jgi:hypothetical protein
MCMYRLLYPLLILTTEKLNIACPMGVDRHSSGLSIVLRRSNKRMQSFSFHLVQALHKINIGYFAVPSVLQHLYPPMSLPSSSWSIPLLFQCVCVCASRSAMRVSIYLQRVNPKHSQQVCAYTTSTGTSTVRRTASGTGGIPRITS